MCDFDPYEEKFFANHPKAAPHGYKIHSEVYDILDNEEADEKERQADHDNEDKTR